MSMRISVSHRPLLEIEIRANPELISSYLFSRDGLWRQLTVVMTTLLLTVAAPALQAALPQAVPELPFQPLAWVTAYLATRRPELTACLAAIAAGLGYDAITFQTLGGTSALLLAIAFAAACWPASRPGRHSPATACCRGLPPACSMRPEKSFSLPTTCPFGRVSTWFRCSF